MAAQGPSRKYRIERYLAEGGMGAIYVGKKLGAGGFEKEVVLKQLLPEFTSRPEFRDLFFREAKISGTLDHVNIVRTYDLVTSDDALFIVMEYVRGADLRTLAWRGRMRRQALSSQAILHVAMEILAGLSYAHGRQGDNGAPLKIIHRDVSPSNILCSAQGDVKLSDFGIAKATTFSSVFYRVRGKVGYMSPEQAHSQPLDGRSDLYSLAVCIFETLTGERLFTGDLQTPPEEIYSQPIPRLSQRCPHLPAALESVMGQALAQNAADRFQTAAEFANALRQVARAHGLLYSASQLAAELHSIAGPNPDLWLSEDDGGVQQTPKIPTTRGLEGREAASLGVVGPPSVEAPAFRPTPPRPVMAVAGSVSRSVPPLPRQTAAEFTAVTRRRPRRRRLLWVAAATLLGACVAGAAVGYVATHDENQANPSAVSWSSLIKAVREKMASWR